MHTAVHVLHVRIPFATAGSTNTGLEVLFLGTGVTLANFQSLHGSCVESHLYRVLLALVEYMC